jgi:heme ABC exporter ATP-binding subunit CcmA
MSLVAQGLAIAKGGKELFAGLSFACQPGEVVAIMGPSGVGKTTLLRLLAGLEDPTTGAIFLDGKSPGTIGWPQFRRSLPYVHQRSVMVDASCWENLQFPFRFASAHLPFDSNRAQALLERLGLKGKNDDQARQLSQGEQQRVALIRALLVKPRFLLLDEPTNALDKASTLNVEELLREQVGEENLGIVMVTHDEAQAERFCDRQIELRPKGGEPRG